MITEDNRLADLIRSGESLYKDNFINRSEV